MAKKSLRCLSCKNLLFPWGTTAAGRKRYYCRNCKITRTFFKNPPKKANIFGLFEKYVLWGYTYEMLSSFSGYSIQHLQRQFEKIFLQESPKFFPIAQSETETFLLLDGLWLKRGFILMAYRQSRNLTILHISVVGREAATKIAKDLRHLLDVGYHFTGIVSDGGTGIVKAVTEVFMHKPHQICLAHRHRDITNALGKYPKRERVKELKALADHVWLIESKEALHWWETQVKLWVKTNNLFLKEKKYDIDFNWWFIHKGVRKAVYILQDLPQTSFKFLDHPLMPKTTNELEAQFGHLGKRWLAHRGLKTEKWEDFMRWFVYFYNRSKISQKKTNKD